MSEKTSYKDRLKQTAVLGLIGALTLAGCSPSESTSAQSSAPEVVAGTPEAFAALHAKAEGLLAIAKADASFTIALGPTDLDNEHDAVVIGRSVATNLPQSATGAEGYYKLTAVGDKDHEVSLDSLANASVIELSLSDVRGGHERPIYELQLTKTTGGEFQADLTYNEPSEGSVIIHAASTLNKNVKDLVPLQTAEDITAVMTQADAVYQHMQAGDPADFVAPIR